MADMFVFVISFQTSLFLACLRWLGTGETMKYRPFPEIFSQAQSKYPHIPPFVKIKKSSLASGVCVLSVE